MAESVPTPADPSAPPAKRRSRRVRVVSVLIGTVLVIGAAVGLVFLLSSGA
jgi:hypothetical protein